MRRYVPGVNSMISKKVGESVGSIQRKMIESGEPAGQVGKYPKYATLPAKGLEDSQVRSELIR